MFHSRRLIAQLCAVLLIIVLMVSGCGVLGAPSPGTDNGGAASDPGSGSSGQTGQGGQGQGQATDGDGEAEPFDVSEWQLFSAYDIVSRFQRIAFEIHSPLDDLAWASFDIQYVGPDQLAGQAVERYQYNIYAPDEVEPVDDQLEMWYAADGTLVGARDLSDEDADVVTETFVLMLTELHTGWMLLPFNNARLVFEEEDVTITSTSFSTDTVLGQRVTVATLEGNATGEDGGVIPFTMRVAEIGGLPFMLEVTGVEEPLTVTPTVIEFR